MSVFEKCIMYITSPAFADGGRIPQKYTCEGEGISVPLAFGDVPENAVSLVLIMDDPDVPVEVRADQMWDHWIVWNIDPHTTTVPEGTEPEGVHGITTSETLAYVRPCPPDKEHRYFFYLYALDALCALQEGATKNDVLAAIDEHIIDRATLMGTYCKKENRV